jgi:hypothetical protein
VYTAPTTGDTATSTNVIGFDKRRHTPARDEPFSDIIDAVRAYEAAADKTEELWWPIGDLLKRAIPKGEHGKKNGSLKQFEPISEVLVGLGFKRWKPRYLRNLRDTAAGFDDASRDASCNGVRVERSIFVHARIPEILRKAIRAKEAEKDGEPLTVKFVDKVKAGIRHRSKAQASTATKFNETMKKARTAVQTAKHCSQQLVAQPQHLKEAQKLHREVFELIEGLQSKLAGVTP